ncbi:hypothetical protein [Streptomyces sp. NPDC050416]|uniref:hypothetical protein n=1 Tax=Streptomyces sp. NPDC050416 TaxID=3365611 RepID=UPI00379B7AB7
MTDQTAYTEVLARLLCAADVHVHGDDHPTWQQLVGEPGGRIRDDYRKAASWLAARLTVTGQMPAAPAVQAPAADRDAATAGFVLWLDASDGSVPTHDGVQWPDGIVTIHHRHFGITTTHHSAEAACQAAHGKQGRIVWPEPAPTDRAEWDALASDTDRLRKAWGEMRDRAERIEAEVQRLTTDRAAVLREAAAHLERQADQLWASGSRAHTVMYADAAELRRMADGAGAWCKCRSCWGWFVNDHPGEDLDELGKDLSWWSGLPVHRDAPTGAQQPGESR